MLDNPSNDGRSRHPASDKDFLRELTIGLSGRAHVSNLANERIRASIPHTSFGAPIVPIPECEQFHSFRSAQEAKRQIAHPSTRMVHTPLSDEIFGRALESYLSRHELYFPAERKIFVGSLQELNGNLQSFLERQAGMPNELRNGLHKRIVQGALQFSLIAETDEICFDMSRRTRAWMHKQENSGERANEYLHYDMAPVFGLWAPFGNQTLSVMEQHIDQPMLTRFMAEGLNDRWLNAMKDNYQVYTAPTGSLLIGKGARLSYHLDGPLGMVSDPDLLSIGTHYHCGSPWLHLVDQMKPDETRLLVRFFTRRLPSYFTQIDERALSIGSRAGSTRLPM